MFTRKSRGAERLDDRLRALVARAPATGIFCDFDGSLAPIVPNPPDARPVRGASRALHALARRFAVVAVVSGRPVSFLVQHLHARGLRLVGLYGIEERIGRRLEVLPDVKAARERVDATAAALRAALPDLYIEHKGYAVAVHFRRAPDPTEAAARATPLVHRIATDHGLSDLARGKMVLEVRPPVSVDKGAVVARIVRERRLTGAIVIGDDSGDIAMFDAAGEVESSYRVAVDSDEAPRELLVRADLRLGSPEDVVELLRALGEGA
ncbi:MAG: trehalose-phosphatase [Actinomycetota bacterium]